MAFFMVFTPLSLWTVRERKFMFHHILTEIIKLARSNNKYHSIYLITCLLNKNWSNIESSVVAWGAQHLSTCGGQECAPRGDAHHQILNKKVTCFFSLKGCTKKIRTRAPSVHAMALIESNILLFCIELKERRTRD